MGHPDKLADRISDSILDAHLAGDPNSRVACETLVTTGLVVVAGEISSKTEVDYEAVVRRAILEVGYNSADIGIDGNTCEVQIRLDAQSPDIAQGVDSGDNKELGAGDQGLMFGYACTDTEELMPLPVALSHKLINRLTEARQSGEIKWLRPDNKTQVTVEYDGTRPVRIEAVVVSAQHSPDVDQQTIRDTIREKIILPLIPAELNAGDIKFHINPTGKFVIGGPHGDCGLTGRKIIVDTYGGWGRHGGGAFSGKDSTKVDRSAAYMARHIAKNIVAAGLADQCEVQLAYAIGVTEPVSIRVDTFGTGKVDDAKLVKIVRDEFPLTPAGIIKHLKLDRPVFTPTSAGGHFGRSGDGFTWEHTDHADSLTKAAG